MPYIITDGKRVVYRDPANGRYCLTPNRAYAEIFERREKAVSVLKNSIPKKSRDGLYVENVAPMKSEDTTAALKSIIKKPKKTSEEYLAFVDTMLGLIGGIDEIKQEAINQLSEIDKEISDLEHFIEFKGKINCYQAWLCYSDLRALLLKRRQLKDKINILGYIQSASIEEKSLNNLKYRIIGLNQRSYTPRRLEELFTCETAS